MVTVNAGSKSGLRLQIGEKLSARLFKPWELWIVWQDGCPHEYFDSQMVNPFYEKHDPRYEENSNECLGGDGEEKIPRTLEKMG